MAAKENLANEWYSDVPRSIGKQTLFGLALIVFLCGGFGAWASIAPLAAAVIAPGSFVATGRNKIIQHLEGGIIDAILVNEGDRVKAGQDLVKLDETAARANARQMFLRQLRLEAIQTRLQAQARSLPRYEPPQSIINGLADPEIKAINDSQRDNFKATQLKFSNQLDLLKENISSLRYQDEGTAAQVRAMQRQRDLLADDLKAKSGLLSSGIVTKSAVNVLERAVADAEGGIAKLQAESRVTHTQIAKYEMEIEQTRDTLEQAALDEMQNVEAELDAVREQIRGADNVLSRTVIKAPVDGVVVRIYYHTSGGVIESGKPILEILPSDVPLIIEAQVPRMQIDEIHLGQAAAIRLTALNQRTTPILNGSVTYVSADSIKLSEVNPAGDVYLARVSIPSDELARVHGFTPTPGMPAEILIKTHERTFFEYLIKPVEDSMARAFSEY